MAGRKRKRGNAGGLSLADVAATLQKTGAPPPTAGETPNLNSTQGKSDVDDPDGGWEVAGATKRHKKDKYPQIAYSTINRLQKPVDILDLQALVLYLIADGPAPRWVSVEHHQNIRKVCVLMVPGLEQGHVQQNKVERVDWSKRLNISPDDFVPVKISPEKLSEETRSLSEMFEHLWPVQTPGDAKYSKIHSPLAAMLVSRITKPKDHEKPRASKEWQNVRTPITDFLATTVELIDEGIVLHPANFEDTPSPEAAVTRRALSGTAAADGWVDTLHIPNMAAGEVPYKDIEEGSITAGRDIIALDCEMCITSAPGIVPPVSSLTRVSMIDWNGKIILDELVKPSAPITDYLTQYSGITAQMMMNVTTTLEDVQAKLLSILTRHTILIGHSLQSDLQALKLTHPFIIDTTLLFPHPRGPPLRSSLKYLAKKYLNRDIQQGHGSTGHDSIEDARACLDLVKQKCEKGKAWATSDASNESIFKRLGRAPRPYRDQINRVGEPETRAGAVVDWGDPARGYGGAAKAVIGCTKDAEVVTGIQRAISGDESDDSIPRGGCDFVWARLRELEAHRGWWDRSSKTDGEILRATTAADTMDLPLGPVLRETVAHIKAIYDSLPPCTAFIVYSGSGDPVELREMHAKQQKAKDGYMTKKWDDDSVAWTDDDDSKLKAACEKARRGIGFVTVK